MRAALLVASAVLLGAGPTTAQSADRADGKTVVSYRRPSAIFGAYGQPDLKMMGDMMDGMLAQLAPDATKEEALVPLTWLDIAFVAAGERSSRWSGERCSPR